MPPWWRLHDRRHSLPWHLHATSPAVVLTPRYVVGLLAFLICVDMTQVLGVLCYQLFLGTYFPWHLYPLMLNRAVELLALLCSDGHVPSVYSVAQIFLSVLSMVICIQKQPCGKFNCVAAVVLYGVLLTYQGTGPPSNSVCEDQDNIKEYNDVIIAVEQPDGEKYAIARLLKDAAMVPELLGPHQESSHLKDKTTAPSKEKTRCESAYKNLHSCENQNPLEESDVSASQVEALHSDDTASTLACEFKMNKTPISGDCLKNEGRSGPEVQLGSELLEHDLAEAETKQDEQEELAIKVLLTSVTTEIVSLFEDLASRDRLDISKEQYDAHS